MIDHDKLRNWYDFQAPFYRLWRNDYDSPLLDRVETILEGLGDDLTVLDAGCGTGLVSIGLGRRRPRWSLLRLLLARERPGGPGGRARSTGRSGPGRRAAGRSGGVK